MRNIPKVIYLNLGFDKDEVDSNADFNDMTEVSWNTARINDADIKFDISEQQIPDHNEITILLNKWVSENENTSYSIAGLKTMLVQFLSSKDLEVTKEVIMEYLKKGY